MLDASSACFNEVNYARRQAYFEARYDDPTEHTVTALILPAVTLPGFLGDIRLDTVQNPISRTGLFHVVTAGSIKTRVRSAVTQERYR